MDPSEEELIAHIKDSLMSHEESYVPGAWEKFNKEEPKGTRLIYWIGPLSGVAAMLLIGGGLYLYTSRPLEKKPLETAKTAQPANSLPVEETATVAMRPRENQARQEAVNSGQSVNVNNATATIEQAQTINAPAAGNNLIAEADPVVSNPAVADARIIASGDVPKENKSISIQEFLNQETLAANHNNKAVAESKVQKWEMGVVVAPSFGNTRKLNMGYGLSMGYAVSDKISLNSGISYNELAAAKNIDAPESFNMRGTAIAGDTKSLESVEARLIGIDVPLELKYHFSKSLYANVGVSAFAVISQKQSNNYIQEKVAERAPSLTDGNSDFNTFLVKEKTTEEAPKSEVNQDKYLGFYNFSFGYRQKISKSKSVSVEPFMKVPMKEVSKENLRLMGTGLRLKFDF
ncbi:MAG TPA: hypothetical protein VKB19_05385 [Pedobacter sp.]|nr:hypothetical protein [Pedobacter sp.]